MVILFRVRIDKGLAQANPLIVVTAQRGVKVAPRAMLADRPTPFLAIHEGDAHEKAIAIPVRGEMTGE
jgi:hypothetical protein